MLKFLKYLIYFAAALLIYSYGSAAEKDKGKADADSECNNFILIQGSSNVNRFQLVNQSPHIKIDSELKDFSGNRNIQIPVYDFKAANNHMLKDFYDMVNVSEYPYIQITIEPKGRADFDETSGLTNFKTEITLAGNSNSYTVPCEIVTCENSAYLLKGNLKIKLTDFNIDPPEKVFGAIKVNNEVFINFVFKLKSEDTLTEKITF
jgi:hypothetical protein